MSLIKSFSSSPILIFTAALMLIVSCFFLYQPGFTGPFLLDDFHVLAPLGYHGGITTLESARTFMFSAEGFTGRPVSMASFILDDSTWPASPYSFKQTNLLLHTACGLLVFLVIREFLHGFLKLEEYRASVLALIAMAIWLLHPVHVSTVLYVVQRMAILGAFFSLIAVLSYLKLRKALTEQNALKSAACFALLITSVFVGFLSKENAILCLLFIVVWEFYLLPSDAFNKLRLKKSHAFLLIAALSLLVVYATRDFWGGAYAGRSFTLTDRILLQPAIVGDYLIKLVFPTVSQFNLFDGRFDSSAVSLLNKDYLFGLFFFLVFLGFLITSLLKKWDICAFGLLWFLVFHTMESTILPLELYFEHRNYLPSIGLLFCVLCGINWLYKKLKLESTVKLCMAVVVVYLTFSTFLLTKTWSETTGLLIKFEGDEPNSVRAKVTLGIHLYNRGLPEFGVAYFEEASALDDHNLSVTLWSLYLSCLLDRDIDTNYQHLIQDDVFDFGSLFVLEKIFSDQVEGRQCLGQAGLTAEDLIQSISVTKGFTLNHVAESGFWYEVSNYYVAAGLFSEALVNLEKAIDRSPSTDLYIRKAVILTSGQLYTEALEAAKKALDFNGKAVKKFKEDRSFEIKAVIDSLEQQIRSVNLEGKANG